MQKIGIVLLIAGLVFAGCFISCASTAEKSEKTDAVKAAVKEEPPASIENLSEAGEASAIDSPKSGIIRKTYTCTYKNDKRSFILCRSADSAPKALAIMLHGYGNSAESFMNQITFDEKAVKEGFVLLFVDGIPDPDDKASTSGWNSGLKDSSKDDLGFLKSLVENFQNEYRLSKDKTFAVGYSNGAFMIHRLAVEDSEQFAAVASVAGFLPESVWKRRPEKISTAFLQINGTKDDVVPMHLNGSAKFNKNPAIEDVLEYYKSAAPNPDSVKHIVIDGGRHAWPEEKFCGFDVDKVLIDFFLSR